MAAFRDFVQIGQKIHWPRTHRWLQPKRVIPPHGYWSENEIAAEGEFGFISLLTNGQLTTSREAYNIYKTTVVLAQHDFPTWHVGRVLVHALLRTTVPADWPVERFKMPFPAVRFVFEKGAFVLEDGSEVVAVQAFLAEPSHLLRLPADIAEELSSLDRGPFIADPVLVREAEAARKALSMLERAPARAAPELVLVTWQVPAAPAKFRFSVHHTLFDTTLGNVLKEQLIPSPEEPGTPYHYRQAADQKRAIVDNVVPLFLNAVLLLTAKPDYVEGGQLARPAKTKGKRTLEALHHPRFLGKKFAYQRGSSSDRTLPGRKLPPGWRAGHWKDIPYGPNRSFRRHDWIEPYQYGLPEAK